MADREPETPKVGIYLATRISSRVPLIVPKRLCPSPRIRDSDVSVKFYWLQARYLDRQGCWTIAVDS